MQSVEELLDVRRMPIDELLPKSDTHPDGGTILMLACESGRIDVIRMLLNRGANLEYGT